MAYETKNMQNIQFGLAQADAILFPETLREQFVPLLSRFHMEEICRDKGLFVDISAFFSAFQEENKPVRVAYMPSVRRFPGLKDEKDYLFLSDVRKKLTELDEALDDGVTVVLYYPKAVRRRFQENIWRHVEFFPDDISPYEYLAQCQGVISDFGEEMYVMKALGRPVWRLTDREADMNWVQGVSFFGGEFPAFENGREAAEQICRYFSGRTDGFQKEDKGDMPSCSEWLREIKRGKNGKVSRRVIYMPEFQNRTEFFRFMEENPPEKCLFFIEKPLFHDTLAQWIREYGNVHYIVILRSLVIGRKESRMIKYHLTTKEKLREKRDRQRYLGER